MATSQFDSPCRPSSSQPLYERPSIVGSTQSTDTYLKSRHRRPSFQRPEYCREWGQDNFSYDPQYLALCEPPEGSLEGVPQELHREVHVWRLALAALETGLDRISRLYDDAVDHAFPDKAKSCHIFSASPSPSNDPDAISAPLVAGALEKLSIVPGSPQIHAVLQGVETPPLTPSITDSSAAVSFAGDQDDFSVSSLDQPLDSKGLRTRRNDDFNEITWETYLRRYSATSKDVRESKSRLNGHSRRIRTLSAEFLLNPDPTVKDAVDKLMDWWAPLEQARSSDFKDRIALLKQPDIDQLRFELQPQL